MDREAEIRGQARQVFGVSTRAMMRTSLNRLASELESDERVVVLGQGRRGAGSGDGGDRTVDWPAILGSVLVFVVALVVLNGPVGLDYLRAVLIAFAVSALVDRLVLRRRKQSGHQACEPR